MIRPTRTDIRAMVRLALPVVIVQVGLMGMGVADTVMVGHQSGEALAAVALGNIYFFAVSMFGVGTLLALDPLVAQAVGAGDQRSITRALQRGLVLAAALSVPTALLFLPVTPILAAARQPAAVVPIASAYVFAAIPGIFPFLAFVVLRQSLQAMGRLRPIVLTILLANLLNIGLNWIFIFGHLGIPEMGAVGSSWASTISRWAMAIGLLLAGWPVLRTHLESPDSELLRLVPLIRMVRLGAPIGVQQTLEFGIFGAVGLLMGWMGTDQVAGHQVALNLASLAFMVPLGVSAAAAVLVGHAVGRDDPLGARRAAGAALLCGTAFMSCSAAVFLLMPATLAAGYTNDPAVRAVAIGLLPLAGIFQLFDGWQVVSIGILRGVADTRSPMIVNVLGFWLVGLPVGAWLAFRADLGPAGLWWGLVVGLGLVGLILLDRVRRRLGRELRRFQLEDTAPA